MATGDVPGIRESRCRACKSILPIIVRLP
jgi:hypothetical protein